ncbi:MAG: hypothetical protein AAF958_10855, partial [Planctomycetota bacterium]
MRCFTRVFLATWIGLIVLPSRCVDGDESDERGPVPDYPIMVAVDGETVFTVDLNLPGVWKSSDQETSLFFAGSKLTRQAMNRPRAIALHPAVGLLVGDSASREIYHIQAGQADGKPLCEGFLGNVMCLAVSPDKQTIYAGDTERRAIFKMPIDGGKPQLVASVNPRGLSFKD